MNKKLMEIYTEIYTENSQRIPCEHFGTTSSISLTLHQQAGTFTSN